MSASQLCIAERLARLETENTNLVNRVFTLEAQLATFKQHLFLLQSQMFGSAGADDGLSIGDVSITPDYRDMKEIEDEKVEKLKKSANVVGALYELCVLKKYTDLYFDYTRLGGSDNEPEFMCLVGVTTEQGQTIHFRSAVHGSKQLCKQDAAGKMLRHL